MATVTNVGAEVDLSLQQGADFGPVLLTFTNPDGTPVNLAGARFSAQMRKKSTDDNPTAEFTVTVLNAAQGTAQITMPAVTTSQLLCGENMGDALGEYIWDLKFVDSAKHVTTPLYGSVSVFREVTR